ncbi:hypothetical protein CKAH01_03180 [Colletotrichum kahawae]|uniref:Uncharacterized protein n=1 Tax=Colletotrichum kahawae TaxID=34407 RepID=A0AAD9YVY5_COLKA|nr:hypothetical protein CKAH01_03180 [Colletotrichum kahawae]
MHEYFDGHTYLLRRAATAMGFQPENGAQSAHVVNPFLGWENLASSSDYREFISELPTDPTIKATFEEGPAGIHTVHRPPSTGILANSSWPMGPDGPDPSSDSHRTQILDEDCAIQDERAAGPRRIVSLPGSSGRTHPCTV